MPAPACLPTRPCPRCLHAVKCLFEAIDKLRTHEEILEGSGSGDRLVLAVPPGRYGRLAQGGQARRRV
jgi:hypothetical protein